MEAEDGATHGASVELALQATAFARVFLLAPRSKKPRAGDTGCRGRATRDHVQIAAALAMHPDCNVGLTPLPGLFVLDDDGGLHAWCAAADVTLPHTLTARTGGGGSHRWFALPREVRGYQVRGGKLDGFDIIGGGGGSPWYAVAPGSIHPNGTPYGWADGCDPDRAPIATAPAELVALLRERNLLEAPGASSTGKIIPLPPRPADPAALVEEALVKRKAKSAGTELRFRCVFHDDEHASASYSTEKRQFYCHGCGAKGGLRKLAAGLGIDIVTEDRTRGAVTRLARLAASVPWKGTGGATRRAVLAYLHCCAQRAGTLEIAAAVRAVALHVGIRTKTAHAALHALRRSGWLRCTGRNDKGTNVYQLGAPPGVVHRGNSTTVLSLRESTVPTMYASDAWRWNGLGKNAALLMLVFDGGAQYATGADVARAARLSPHTARRLLKRMVKDGLVSRIEGKWGRGQSAVEDVARTLPSWGAAAKQRELYVLERDEHERRRQEYRDEIRLRMNQQTQRRAARWRARRPPRPSPRTTAPLWRGIEGVRLQV